MKSANTKLKSELLGLIDQMETQLVRIQTARAERFRDKKKARLARQANKDRTYLENTHKITRLKREIEQMYIELEHQYNNEGLVELENTRHRVTVVHGQGAPPIIAVVGHLSSALAGGVPMAHP